jgi:uncharacterized protein YceK
MRNVLLTLGVLSTITNLVGCATAVAVTDAAASTAIYAGKTVINVIDAVTPDIVNKD